MIERTRFVLAYQNRLYSMAELCQRFAVIPPLAIEPDVAVERRFSRW